MNKAILIFIFIFCELIVCSQGLDLIVTQNGETIFCRTDSITDTHIYFAMEVKNRWVHTFIDRNLIRSYQLSRINEDFLVFEKSTNFINEKANRNIYKTWVDLINESFKAKGVLYELKDSYILISNSDRMEDYGNNNFETMNLYIHNIEVIRIRRKNNIGRGVWMGALSGFALGILVTLPDLDDWLFAAFPFAVIGSGIGALVGTIKVRVPINGNLSNYNKCKRKLNKYSLQRESNKR